MLIVKLSDIVDAMQMQSDAMAYYLNKKTGEIALVTEEAVAAAENDELLERFPEWQQEDIKLAWEIGGNICHVPLPTRFDIHEYEIMAKFCLSIRHKEASRDLSETIRGRGAFKRFHEGIEHYGIAEDWHEYKNVAYREIAREWCRDNNIEFEEGNGHEDRTQ
ncbi:MAG: hypothetical protein HQL22_06915 [Candidatus Omnitrophica bacterium]|nr:hypothetical protein [Candidatus Omnitrophota bacterium]